MRIVFLSPKNGNRIPGLLYSISNPIILCPPSHSGSSQEMEIHVLPALMREGRLGAGGETECLCVYVCVYMCTNVYSVDNLQQTVLLIP